ncbi:hypothetical protein H4Q26_009532 [Puccinia striiformis f. sp. tritici PST-130]|nr:hypothetical protein H4Q26_009532 [Puccinia striiformis f. sp. tritici PST-130]
MGAHLRNGRNISAEQQQRTLNTCQSSYQPSAAERLRRVREQLAASTGTGRITPSGSDRFQSRSIAKDINHLTTSIDTNPTEENRQERPTTALASPRTTKSPSFVYGRGTLYPPSAIATTMLDQQWTLFQRAQQSGTLLEESIQNNNSEHSDPSADANHADGYVDPGSPRNESNPYRQRTGNHLPGSYPLGDPVPLTPPLNPPPTSPGVPEPTRRNQTGYGSTSSYQPTTSTPYVNQQPYYQNPLPTVTIPTAWPNCAPGRRRPDATVRMVRMENLSPEWREFLAV